MRASHCTWTKIQTSYHGAQGQCDLMPELMALTLLTTSPPHMSLLEYREDLFPGSSPCKALTQLYTWLAPLHPLSIYYNVTSSKRPSLNTQSEKGLSMPLH